MSTFDNIMSTVAAFAGAPGHVHGGLAQPLPIQTTGVDQAVAKVADLQSRVDRLALVCMAMWSLLRDTGMTDEKLLERMKEIDLSDGQLDGKVRIEKVTQCPKCGRAMNKRNARCIYCGTVREGGSPFDGVE